VSIEADCGLDAIRSSRRPDAGAGRARQDGASAERGGILLKRSVDCYAAAVEIRELKENHRQAATQMRGVDQQRKPA